MHALRQGKGSSRCCISSILVRIAKHGTRSPINAQLVKSTYTIYRKVLSPKLQLPWAYMLRSVDTRKATQRVTHRTAQWQQTGPAIEELSPRHHDRDHLQHNTAHFDTSARSNFWTSTQCTVPEGPCFTVLPCASCLHTRSPMAPQRRQLMHMPHIHIPIIMQLPGPFRSNCTLPSLPS